MPERRVGSLPPYLRSKRSDKDEMSLPVGKACADCLFFPMCEWLISCHPHNEVCDWSPSRYKEAVDGG